MSQKRRKIKTAEYDAVAVDWYQQRKAGLSPNEYIEMPAVFKLLGNVKGKKVLDLGCGPGLHAKKLLKKGASVWGVDISQALLQFAEQEAPKAHFQKASMTNLPFADTFFDIVLASLSLNHVKNLNKAFSEVHRVLKKKGLFVFSVGNPVLNCREKVKIAGTQYALLGYEKNASRIFGDYFTEKDGVVAHGYVGKKKKVTSYRRTYETMIKTIVKHNFTIVDYIDAKPIAAYKKVRPHKYKVFSRLPQFCCWKVQKV